MFLCPLDAATGGKSLRWGRGTVLFPVVSPDFFLGGGHRGFKVCFWGDTNLKICQKWLIFAFLKLEMGGVRGRKWRHQNFLRGALRGQNAILRGQKSKNSLKIFLLTPETSGGRASNWDGEMSLCPLDAATGGRASDARAHATTAFLQSFTNCRIDKQRKWIEGMHGLEMIIIEFIQSQLIR